MSVKKIVARSPTGELVEEELAGAEALRELEKKLNAAARGTANGVAPLDGEGKVPVEHLPEEALAPAVTVYVPGTEPPADTGVLWIDTNATTGGLKYHNGTAWVHVPVAYT